MNPPADITAVLACLKENNVSETEKMASFLLSKADMLKEYLALEIITQDDKVLLTHLPLLVNGYVPSMAKLPSFLIRLIKSVMLIIMLKTGQLGSRN